MFSYYGSKSKIVHLYPKPKHDLIIEPFAGSARYALRYFDRDVILIDKFHKIMEIWKYLQQASEKDILGLPDISYKEKIPESLSLAEKWLIGYCVGRGTPRPATMGHQFNDWNFDKVKIAKQLFKIRHWKFIHGTYECLDNPTATWYIDPPYINGGHKYSKSNKDLDFAELAEWSKSRNGQVIVCENDSASWLPFLPLIKNKGQMKEPTYEVFWTNEKVEYQPSMF